MNSTVRSFGKYLLDQEIARGGMSRVYLGRLRGLGGFEKKLVVKQVLPELARDPRFVSMFVHEAKTLVQMSHPHIAPVYELGVVDGVYFLAMEYVEGATLAAILRHGPLAPGLVSHLGAEICDALHYAHSRFDIVHRDVTPRNVIVDRAGHCRLLDFGIAAPVDDAEGTELFGTPGYLSPEQLENGALGASSDVFSLGAVLYEALTGRRAFPGKTVDETRAALEADGPRFDAADQVPEELAAIISRALARDPEGRYGSARALGRALRGWLAGHAPEGLDAELGERAHEAERSTRRPAPSDDTPEAGSGGDHVQTLATSRVLDALLATEAPEDGTVPIEGRRSHPPAGGDTPATAGGSEPGTRPLDGRESRGPSHAAAPEQGSPRSDVDRSSPAARWPWLGASALLLVAAALSWMLWPGSPPPVPSARSAIEAPSPGPTPAPAHPEEERSSDEEVAAPEPARAPPPSATSEPAPAARADGVLTVNATPWAEVRLDGRAVGTTPKRHLTVRPGRHTVELSCPPLGRRARATVDAPEGGLVTVIADLSQEPPLVRVR